MPSTPLVNTEEGAPAKRPSIDDTAQLFKGPLGVRSLALTGIFLLACFYTLYFARDFFLPVVLALVLNFLLAPLVRLGKRFRIPEALSAALVMASLILGLLGLAYQLSSPLAEWLERAPEIGSKIQSKMQPLRERLQKITKASDQVEGLATVKAEGSKAPQSVELKPTSFLNLVFSGTSKVVFSTLVVVVLLFFFLASGDLFLSKLVHVLPTLSDKKKAVQIAREVERNISRYLVTITIINVGIGVASGFLFWAFGLPNPALWGAVAGAMNFIPTVGALSVAAVITLVATVTFPSLSHALLLPAAFLGITITTGTFISPILMGQRLTLNPVVIFLGLSFWGWLWGIPGALLAVPMLAMFKIFCDHIEPLAPIGEFLGH